MSGNATPVRKDKRGKPLKGVAANPALRGPGPAKGTPLPGRPPSEVVRASREGYYRALPKLIAMALREGEYAEITPTEQQRAIDLLGKYGALLRVDVTSGGETIRPVVMLPTLLPPPSHAVSRVDAAEVAVVEAEIEADDADG